MDEAQIGQNVRTRTAPLSAILSYVDRLPEWRTNELLAAATVIRNAVPERTWQSAQWQIVTELGSATA